MLVSLNLQRSFEPFIFHSTQEEGRGRLANGTMCVFKTTRTDELENAEFFLLLVRPLPAGGCKCFDNRSVYHKSVLIINVMKSIYIVLHI